MLFKTLVNLLEFSLQWQVLTLIYLISNNSQTHPIWNQVQWISELSGNTTWVVDPVLFPDSLTVSEEFQRRTFTCCKQGQEAWDKGRGFSTIAHQEQDSLSLHSQVTDYVATQDGRLRQQLDHCLHSISECLVSFLLICTWEA